MIKASALYLVIVVALVIGLICAALVGSAYYYQLQYQKQSRYLKLQSNLQSGTTIILHSNLPDTASQRSLFGKPNDSVVLASYTWGLFDIGTVKAFIQTDTLRRAFSIGHQIDSAKWAALYIIDEDRSISVNGKTSIKGNAYLPKAGIKPAYINGRAYEGDPKIVSGHQYASQKTLPTLNDRRLKGLNELFKKDQSQMLRTTALPDSVRQSWFKPELVYQLGKHPVTLTNCRLSGRIVLKSDTIITIDSTVVLNDIIVVAKAIVVKNGFNGNCQLFATDSISIGKRCTLNYPSCAGVLRFNDKPIGQEKISLGDGSVLWGSLFTYQQADNKIRPLIDLGKGVTVKGQIYASGQTGIHGTTLINGNLTTGRFIYRAAYTIYENYMIDLHLDESGLSRYYLSSDLFPATAQNKKIIQWLAGK